MTKSPYPFAERYRTTLLPLGTTDEALEAYLRDSSAEWLISLRSLLVRLDPLVLAPPPLPAGRRRYHPLCLLALLIYGLLLNVRSLRALSRLARLDVGAWYLCCGAQPHFTTLGDFFLSCSKTLPDAFFIDVTRRLLRHLRQAHGQGFLPGAIALDGSVHEASSSRHRVLASAAAIARRDALSTELDDEYSPQAERLWTVLQGTVETLKERESINREHGDDPKIVHVAPGELDAVYQPDKTGKRCPSYHSCIAVEQHRLIVGQDVHGSSELDGVRQCLGQYQAIHGQKAPWVMADTLFCNYESLQLMEQAGEEVLCPPREPVRKRFALPLYRGLFDKTAFTYDASTKELVCPAGRKMKRRAEKQRRKERFVPYQGVGCHRCEARARCTTSPKGRTVHWYEVDERKLEQRAKLRQPAARARYALRGTLVELSYADLKARFACTRFRRRGLRKVRLEFSLWCIAYNLWRSIGLLASAA